MTCVVIRFSQLELSTVYLLAKTEILWASPIKGERGREGMGAMFPLKIVKI